MAPGPPVLCGLSPVWCGILSPQTSPEPQGSIAAPSGQAPAGKKVLWVWTVPCRIYRSSRVNYVPNSLGQSKLFRSFPITFPLALYVAVGAGAPPDLFKDVIPLPEKQGHRGKFEANARKFGFFPSCPAPGPCQLSPLPAPSRSKEQVTRTSKFSNILQGSGRESKLSGSGMESQETLLEYISP